MILRFCILTNFFCISFFSSAHAGHTPPATPHTYPINSRPGMNGRPVEDTNTQSRIARPRQNAPAFLTVADYMTTRAAQLLVLLNQAPVPNPIQIPTQAAQNVPQPQDPAVTVPTQNVVIMNANGIVRAYKEIEMTEDLRVRAEECLTRLRTEGTNVTCPVCLDPLAPLAVEKDYAFTECGHLYCKPCLDQTSGMNSLCPTCERILAQDSATEIQQ